MRPDIFTYCSLVLLEQVSDLREIVEQAYSDAVSGSGLVIFSISSAVKEGIHIKIGSHMICAPYNSSLYRPLLQMVLFAHRRFDDGSFGCLKSIAPKSIARMMVTSGFYASPTEYIPDWIFAKHKSESPNAVTNPPCQCKKPLLPALFDIPESKKTSSTVSAIPESEDNVKYRPYYDISMTVAEGNRVSNKRNLKLGKAGSRLPFRVEPNNSQQQGQSTLMGGSHDARLQAPILAQEVACIYCISKEKMPTAAGSVKFADADEGSMLTKQSSPQEQFILNSSGDGGSGHPHSNSDLRITPCAEKDFTPMVTELTGIDPQHLRKNGLASEDDTQNATYRTIYMMDGSHGTNADQSVHYVFILDSGAAYHCTGDRSLLSDYHDEVRPDRYLRGAAGTPMRVHGTGSINNENFQVDNVLHIPDLNNLENISKTIFSVGKLNEHHLSVVFYPDGTSSVIDNSKRTWNLKHKIVGEAQKVHGQFMLDYLRIPPNRDTMPMLEGPGLLKKLWNASLPVWSSITVRLSQRTTSTQRLPV